MFDFLDPNPNRVAADGLTPLLPLDIIVAVISYLDSTADLASIARTSRIHHYLALPYLYRHVTLRPTYQLPSSPVRSLRHTPFLAALATLQKPMIAGCVHHLTIRGPLGTSHQAQQFWAAGMWSDAEGTLALSFAGILGNLDALQSFTWDVPDTFPHPFLYVALSRHPTLSKLAIRYPEPPLHCSPESRPPPFIVPPFPRLKELRILDYGTPPWQDNIVQLVTGSPSVTRFALSFRPETVLVQRHFSGQAKQIATKPLLATDVRFLSIMDVVDGFFDSFFDAERIRNLVLWDCKIASESWQSFFAPSDCSPAMNGSAHSPGTPTTPHSATTSTVKQSPKSTMSDEPKRAMAMYSTNVLTPQYINPLFTFSSALNRLYFVDSDSNSTSLTPSLKSTVLTAITTRLPSIQKLRLSRTWVLSRDDLTRLVRACPNLIELMICMHHEHEDILRFLTPFLPSLTAIIMMDAGGDAVEKGRKELADKKDVIEAHLAVDGFTGIKYLGVWGAIAYVAPEIRWDGRLDQGTSGIGMQQKLSAVDEQGRVARRATREIDKEQASAILEVVRCEKGVDI